MNQGFKKNYLENLIPFIKKRTISMREKWIKKGKEIDVDYDLMVLTMVEVQLQL